jgi:hydrogenase nickel incorporation protein HypB
LAELDLILVENVGNLICPAEFRLGSQARVVVISVTEGPWMVRKHPRMFLGARLVVINKLDFAATMGVDVERLKSDVHTLKPDIAVFTTSCKTGEGIDTLADALLAL